MSKFIFGSVVVAAACLAAPTDSRAQCPNGVCRTYSASGIYPAAVYPYAVVGPVAPTVYVPAVTTYSYALPVVVDRYEVRSGAVSPWGSYYSVPVYGRRHR